MAEDMQNILQKRLIMITGKGGVGKTTTTAALARIASEQGKRVLALDIDKEKDAPSSLLALLCGERELPTDGTPRRISASLSCARLSPETGQHDFLRDEIPFQLLARAAVRSKQLNRFLMAAPSFQETGIIYRLLRYLRQKDAAGAPTYDFVLVDLPATGHALAMTSLPQPLLKVFKSGPIERTIRESQSYFNDPKVTGCLVVSLPEPLPVSETFQLIAGLQRDQMGVVGVLVNRIPGDPLSADEKQSLETFFGAHRREFLGEWSFRRILRAEDALREMHEGIAQRKIPAPVIEIKERYSQASDEILADVISQLTLQMQEPKAENKT